MHNLCRRHVPVENRTAIAAMLPLGQSLGLDRPALRTGLRGSARIDQNNLPPSVCSFVGEHRGQLRPRGVVNRLGQHRAGQRLHVEVFQGNVGMLPHQAARELVEEVATARCNLGLMPGNSASGALPARREPMLAGQAPNEIDEAMRDLVRARQSATNDVRRLRTRIQLFLLRHDLRYATKPWSYRHRVWLTDRRFPHPAQQIAFQSYLNALEQAESRKADLERQIAEVASQWSLRPLVQALQGLRGVGLVIAATIVAEVGDFNRFASPRQLMAYLGLVPGERSSGRKIRPGAITKAGNTAARSLLFEAAWSYRSTPKVGQWMARYRPDEVSQAVKDLAWKAQLRLHGRYKKLLGRGKRPTVAITAVARELVGFIWAIAKLITPPREGTPAA
jgi:hypothetical protein